MKTMSTCFGNDTEVTISIAFPLIYVPIVFVISRKQCLRCWIHRGRIEFSTFHDSSVNFFFPFSKLIGLCFPLSSNFSVNVCFLLSFHLFKQFSHCRKVLFIFLLPNLPFWMSPLNYLFFLVNFNHLPDLPLFLFLKKYYYAHERTV